MKQIIITLNTLTGTAKNIFLAAVELIAFSLSILILTIAYNTFANIPAPLVLNVPDVVTARHVQSDEDAHEITLIRNLQILRPYEAKITSEIKLKNTILHAQLQDGHVLFNKTGNATIAQLYYISHIPPGEWCLETTITWRPFLSLVEHSVITPPSCFALP